jgi:hypothetical protein
MAKKKIKPGRVIIIALIVIGGLTVLDNTWRLGRELGSAIRHTLSTHRWNMVVIK